jgi:hypothetical protein
MRRRPGFAGWCLLACLAGRAGVASGTEPQAEAVAPADKQEAQRLLAEGNRLFRDGRYDEALHEYRAAFLLVPSQKLHFNMALAQKMRGDPVAAAAELDLFMADPGDADAELRADAGRYLRELMGMVGTVQIATLPPGAVALIDGVPLPRGALSRPIRLAAGRHEVVVKAAGAVDWKQATTLGAGTVLALVPILEPAPAATATPAGPALLATRTTPAPPAVTAEARPFYRRWWFWAAVAGATGAGVAVFALHGGGASCKQSENCWMLQQALTEMKP